MIHQDHVGALPAGQDDAVRGRVSHADDADLSVTLPELVEGISQHHVIVHDDHAYAVGLGHRAPLSWRVGSWRGSPSSTRMVLLRANTHQVASDQVRIQTCGERRCRQGREGLTP
jgi:hypothetical protein